MAAPISFQVSESTRYKAKMLKIPLKTLASTLVERYVNDADDLIGRDLMMDMIQDKIVALENEVKNLELKTKLLDQLKQELEVYKEETSTAKESIEYQKLITYLNKRIIGNHYDLEVIQLKYNDTIKLLTAVNPNFDIKSHITKVRLLQEDYKSVRTASVVNAGKVPPKEIKLMK